MFGVTGYGPVRRAAVGLAAFCLLASSVSSDGVFSSASAAERTKRSVITKPKFDPAAEKIGLFEGMKAGQLEVTVVAKDEKQGNLLIENKSDKPVTVQLPDAIVGVPILKQFGGGMGMGGGAGGGGNNNNNQQQQQVGGGFGGGGLGGGGLGGGGFGGGGGLGGFFSVPPEKVVRVPYHSVCLNHGKAEPRPRSLYKIIPVEEYTQDASLQELIRMVGTGKLDQQSAQAAAWHLTDKMSWQELANKSVNQIGFGPSPYFTPAQLYQAQGIVAQASVGARERTAKAGNEAKPEPKPVSNPRLR